jgi:hypothetical protein
METPTSKSEWEQKMDILLKKIYSRADKPGINIQRKFLYDRRNMCILLFEYSEANSGTGSASRPELQSHLIRWHSFMSAANKQANSKENFMNLATSELEQRSLDDFEGYSEVSINLSDKNKNSECFEQKQIPKISFCCNYEYICLTTEYKNYGIFQK